MLSWTRPALLGLGVVVFAGLLTLVIAGKIDLLRAVELAVLLGVAAMGLLALWMIRRADGKVLRLDRKTVKLLDPLDKRIDGLRAELSRVTASVESLERAFRLAEERRAAEATSVLAALGEDRVEAMSRSELHANLLIEIGAELRERLAPAVDAMARAPR
ncbi:hypothetical protein [Acrocarpospora sp. B8E8]|uniref:hypothetical protein n=1 Tax=Acrocarpospora sp. B8E8 TaxID=3153572 RepID=UPI00325CF1C2